MQRLRQAIRALADCEAGATAAEYAVIISSVAIAVGAGLFALDKNLQSEFGRSATGLQETGTGPASKPVAGKPTSTNATTTKGETTVFADSFATRDKADKKKWAFTGDEWDYKKGQLVGGKPQKAGDLKAFAVDTHGKDYAVSTHATLVSGKGYGLFVRASGERVNGYSFQLEKTSKGGQFTMRKWTNGYEIWPPLATAATPKGYQVNGVRRQVEVSAHGPTLTAKVNGKAVLAVEDKTHKEGKAGLRVLGGGQTRFHEFAVKKEER